MVGLIVGSEHGIVVWLNLSTANPKYSTGQGCTDANACVAACLPSAWSLVRGNHNHKSGSQASEVSVTGEKGKRETRKKASCRTRTKEVTLWCWCWCWCRC